MTPKEKAKELFNKMDMIIYTDQYNDENQCIRCALVAVDEIIKANPHRVSTMKYWNEVRHKIEKL